MQNIRNFNLLKLIPPSLQGDTQVQAACSALEGEMQAVSVAIDQIMIISKLDQQPEEVIDSLAWQWHVDFYEDTMDINTKIALVKNAIAWHRRKGTAGMVQEYVSTVLTSGEVTEWFQYDGQPYHFKVQTNGVITSQDAYERLVKLINLVKNTRSWLDSIQINRQWSGTLYIGGALYSGKTIAISPAKFILSNGSAPLFVGGVVLSGKIMTINPEHYMVDAQGKVLLQFGGVILNGKTVTIQ